MNKFYIVFSVTTYVISAINFINAMEVPKELIVFEQTKARPGRLEIFHKFEELPNELQEYVLINAIKDIVDFSDNIFEAHTKFSVFLKNIVLVNRYFKSLIGYFRVNFLKFMEEKFGNPFTRDTQEELKRELTKIFNSASEQNNQSDEEKAAKIILAGADVNFELGSFLEPILKKAVAFGYARLVKLLLEHGADIDAKNLLGFTPLYEAIAKKNNLMVKFLLDRGANPNIKYVFNRTALMEAVDGGSDYIALQLLKHNVDICAKDLDGNIAYFIAKRRKNKEMAKRLKPTKKCVIS